MSPIPLPAAPLVTRVADYEPAAVRGPHPLPTVADPVRGPAPRPPSPAPAPGPDPRARAAAAFADAALRRVLEVIDRRRPLAQLRPLLSSGLVDSLLPLLAARPAGPARLRRVTAQPIGDCAEIAASYSRGERLHAVACRVQPTAGPTGPRWQVVALHLG